MQSRQPKIVQLGKIHFKRNRTAITERLQIKKTVIIRSDTVKAHQPVLINKCQNKLIAPEICQVKQQQQKQHQHQHLQQQQNIKRPHHHQTQQSALGAQHQQQSGLNRILTRIFQQPITKTHRNGHR